MFWKGSGGLDPETGGGGARPLSLPLSFFLPLPPLRPLLSPPPAPACVSSQGQRVGEGELKPPAPSQTCEPRARGWEKTLTDACPGPGPDPERVRPSGTRRGRALPDVSPQQPDPGPPSSGRDAGHHWSAGEPAPGPRGGWGHRTTCRQPERAGRSRCAASRVTRVHTEACAEGPGQRWQHPKERERLRGCGRKVDPSCGVRLPGRPSATRRSSPGPRAPGGVHRAQSPEGLGLGVGERAVAGRGLQKCCGLV